MTRLIAASRGRETIVTAVAGSGSRVRNALARIWQRSADVAGNRISISRYIRQLSFLAVGATCFILQLASLAVLIHIHVGDSVANAASFIIAAEIKFALSWRLVWRDRAISGGTCRRFAWFNATTGLIFFADQATFAATDGFLTAIPAAVLGVAVGTVASYVVCDHFIFRSASRGTTLEAAIETSEPLSAGAESLSTEAQRIRGCDLSPSGVAEDAAARLWLVVPAYNEEARLGNTLDEYRRSLSADDRLVIVVNGSTDGTEEVARRAAAEDPRLIIIVDERKIGKGGALLAGYRFVAARAAKRDIVGYTDADAAVAGDEMVRFCGGVSSGELRVGSRWHDTTTQLRRQPLARQVASRVFNRCVRTALHLDVRDTQCSAKALCAEGLPDVISRLDSSGFAFDVDLILSARAANFVITEVPVLWTDQQGSTVSMRRAAPAMLREVMRLRRKYGSLTETPLAGIDRASPSSNPMTMSGTPNGSMPPSAVQFPLHPARYAGHGAWLGFGIVDETPVGSHVYANIDAGEAEDRQRVLSGRQKVVLSSLAVMTTASLIAAPIATMVTLIFLLTIFFSAANLVKLDLIRRGASSNPHLRVNLGPRPRLPDEQLPIYTILLPVYHEDAIFRQLIDGIMALDYPQGKLDVKLLLEEDDVTTRQAAADLDLPACFEVVIIPDDGPTGKPRACNAGLVRARGEYLVIYDAEDRPERDQLRKAVDAFRGRAREGRLHASEAQLFQSDSQPIDEMVYRGILALV